MFFSVRTKKLPFSAPSSKLAGGGRVRRVWNTRTNHGQAPERRVCVLTRLSVIQALAGTGKDERGLVERSLSSSREVRMPRSNKV